MKKLFVNTIHHSSHARYGLARDEYLALVNFAAIFGEGKAGGLLRLASENPQFHIIERAFQFVCVVQKNENGISMQLIDFFGNPDNALDEYTLLESQNRSRADVDKIVDLAHKINQDPDGEKAELVEAVISSRE